jgi:CRP/FNR family transcriptional regulator, cyclic AMP receptor protein
MMHKWSRTSSHPNRRGWRHSRQVDPVMGVMTIDRLNVLRSVRIFAGTPDAMLAEISAVLEELRFRADERIFSKGDLGDCLYIIAAGHVRVHDGARTLNTLHRGEVFGEMAALDPEVRSASITALTDTRLLRLDRGPLYRVMAQRIEVAQGIMHVLAQRLRTSLREMNEDFQHMQQFAKLTAAAAAIEDGIYDPESLDDVAARTDALGQLARLFQRMERAVSAREQRLRQEVRDLRIVIDETRQAQKVAEITESDYFQRLRSQASQLRNIMERTDTLLEREMS